MHCSRSHDAAIRYGPAIKSSVQLSIPLLRIAHGFADLLKERNA
jgi:hypothetical protein